MQAEQIAKTLGNAKKANGQWVASCPVPGHGKGNGDRNPSLSIDINDDGKPLFHCHGGCSQEDVFQTIRELHLLPELMERPDPLANIKPIPRNVLEQEWQYQDEDRQTVFVKQRYKVGEAGKTYRLYKVDADGRRHSSLGDARIVPYNLPALLDAKTAGRNIFLVEGEKAADAITSIGMIATTAHTGAGSWPEAITEYFAGAQVIILPDNDVPGWQYAHKAAQAILPIAKSVKVVDLGLQGQGDDAYEFIEAGAGREKLVALVKAAQIITSVDQVTMPERLNSIINEVQTATPPAEDIAKEFETEPTIPTKPPKQINIEHWDTIQDEPVKWMIDKVLPVGSFSALFGPPGSFKSFIALDIAEAIATGRTWMGNQVTEQGAVLYLCGEGFGGVGARIKAIKQHHGTEDGAPIYVIRHQLNLRSSVEDFNALMIAVENLVTELGINFKLIIIDTLARAFGGGNENDSSDMGSFISSCGRIQQIVQDCALMILHHSGKDATKGLRGHSSLLGAVDTELELIRFEDSMKGIIRTAKQKDGEDGTRIGFEMVSVELAPPAGSLQIGEPITSLAVQASELGEYEGNKKTGKSNAGSGRNQRMEMQCLLNVIKRSGILKYIESTQRNVVSLEDWRAELWSKMGCTDEDKSSFKMAWKRAKERLVDSEQGGIRDGFVWMQYKSEDKEEY